MDKLPESGDGKSNWKRLLCADSAVQEQASKHCKRVPVRITPKPMDDNAGLSHWLHRGIERYSSRYQSPVVTL